MIVNAYVPQGSILSFTLLLILSITCISVHGLSDDVTLNHLLSYSSSSHATSTTDWDHFVSVTYLTIDV